MSRRGLSGLQRRGARGNGGGRSAALIAPSAPSIAGAVTIGGTATRTAGVGGGPVDHTEGFRDGVSRGTVTFPYTYVAADIGVDLTWKDVGPSGLLSPVSNTLAYDPPTIAAVVEWLRISGLANGAAAALTGSKAGWAFVQASAGKRPVKGTTNGPNGGVGLLFDGVDDCMVATPDLTAHSALRMVAAITGATAGTALLFELSDSFNSFVQTFAIGVAFSGAGKVSAGCDGASGIGYTQAAQSLASPLVFSVCVDTHAANGCAFIRANGVALPLVDATAGCDATNWLTSRPLNFGARADGAAFPFSGAVGGEVLWLSGNAQDGDLADAEAYCKNKAGL